MPTGMYISICSVSIYLYIYTANNIQFDTRFDIWVILTYSYSITKIKSPGKNCIIFLNPEANRDEEIGNKMTQRQECNLYEYRILFCSMF